ncbi:alpha/beta hydrolase [Marinomonas sp. 15G1-11]|uniref:Alpha/beta hydrolase n=1 Tax=Marinomonas phaeophyticola TaxID=3004091 RepID=A0ABT4JWZ0_9GAMM|nr:alpha/beta hydrolase [Marinomonas sp. 15G1-11]MCZ2722890.1 alpha/beta hydrolase [Marinomonas sp. 15G1-11]
MSEVFFIKSTVTHLAYRLYHNPQAKQGSCLLLLHGAGVGGELTWEGMIPYLTNWQTILVPDLKGMGESRSHSGEEEAFTARSLAEDVDHLLDDLNWLDFDMVGYSLGGLVILLLNQIRVQKGQPKIEKIALLEPATLEREDLLELQQVRNKYRAASSTIRETGDVELGIANFMDGVSPNRRKHPIAEKTTQTRLAHRPFGFAYALDCVTDLVDDFVTQPHLRGELLKHTQKVLIFSGGISHDSLRAHYDVLQEQLDGWQHFTIAGADHSLPFQKPRQIGYIINEWFALDRNEGD